MKATFADETLGFSVTDNRPVNGGSDDDDYGDYEVVNEDYADPASDPGSEIREIHAGIEVDAEGRELEFEVQLEPGVSLYHIQLF